jgi:hypothetical protein
MDQKEILDHAFNTSPDTVYGILIAFMALAIAALWLMIWFKDKKFVDLTIQTIVALKDVNSVLISIKENGVVMTDKLEKAITEAREHLDLKIENLESKSK